MWKRPGRVVILFFIMSSSDKIWMEQALKDLVEEIFNLQSDIANLGHEEYLKKATLNATMNRLIDVVKITRERLSKM